MSVTAKLVVLLVLVGSCSLAVEAADQGATNHAPFLTRLRWAFFNVPEQSIISDLNATPNSSLTTCQTALALYQQNSSDDQARLDVLTEEMQEHDQQCQQQLAPFAATQQQLVSETLQDAKDQTNYENCSIALSQCQTAPSDTGLLAEYQQDYTNCSTALTQCQATPNNTESLSDCQTTLANDEQNLSACEAQVNGTMGDISKYDQLYAQVNAELTNTQTQLSNTQSQLTFETAQSQKFQQFYQACEQCATSHGDTC